MYDYDVRADKLEVGISSQVDQYEQLFIDYGERPDDFLCLCYGFVLRPAENVFTRLEICVDEISDALVASGYSNDHFKIKSGRHNSIAVYKSYFVRGTDGENSN